jgi:hypothetical protein
MIMGQRKAMMLKRERTAKRAGCFHHLRTPGWRYMPAPAAIADANATHATIENRIGEASSQLRRSVHMEVFVPRS